MEALYLTPTEYQAIGLVHNIRSVSGEFQSDDCLASGASIATQPKQGVDTDQWYKISCMYNVVSGKLIPLVSLATRRYYVMP